MTERALTLQAVAERLALEEIHDEGGRTVVELEDVVHRDHVRVLDRAHRAGLAEEPRAEGGVVTAAEEKLQCDAFFSDEVRRGPDRAHAAGPERSLEPVAARDDLTGLEIHPPQVANQSPRASRIRGPQGRLHPFDLQPRCPPVRPAFLLPALVLLASSCHSHPEAPALPEVLMVVDTDLPTPLVAARLRVDLYSQDGTWFASSDFGRPDPRDWPASFSVYSDDDSRNRQVRVRLRTYPEGAIDTYAGAARLLEDGVDVTPAAEPSPRLTVDRVVLVDLRPGDRQRVQLTLHGACVGTVASLEESCVDTPKMLAPVTLSIGDGDLTTPAASAVGTWLAGGCPARDDASARVCIPGGATILGSRENTDYLAGTPLVYDPAPPRVFGLSPFSVDRDELTVGDLRAMIAAGYDGPHPPTNNGPLAQSTAAASTTSCTWSLTAPDRGAYPLTCVSFAVARAICQYRGGDLPTEAQWEHVATVAGHAQKVRFPWGQEEPTCERAIWGRIPLLTPTAVCAGGAGPRLPSEAQGDVNPLGVRGLFGSVAEWALDTPAAFDSDAWAAADTIDPHVYGASTRQILRGNSWMTDAQRPIYREAFTGDAKPPIGVRCAYPVSP